MRMIIKNIIMPITRRLGSTIGAYLAALGMAQPDIATVVAALPLVVGTIIDLIYTNVAQRKGLK